MYQANIDSEAYLFAWRPLRRIPVHFSLLFDDFRSLPRTATPPPTVPICPCIQRRTRARYYQCKYKEFLLSTRCLFVPSRTNEYTVVFKEQRRAKTFLILRTWGLVGGSRDLFPRWAAVAVKNREISFRTNASFFDFARQWGEKRSRTFPLQILVPHGRASGGTADTYSLNERRTNEKMDRWLAKPLTRLTTNIKRTTKTDHPALCQENRLAVTANT